jgi:hypothetical protein
MPDSIKENNITRLINEAQLFEHDAINSFAGLLCKSSIDANIMAIDRYTELIEKYQKNEYGESINDILERIIDVFKYIENNKSLIFVRNIKVDVDLKSSWINILKKLNNSLANSIIEKIKNMNEKGK